MIQWMNSGRRALCVSALGLSVLSSGCTAEMGEPEELVDETQEALVTWTTGPGTSATQVRFGGDAICEAFNIVDFRWHPGRLGTASNGSNSVPACAYWLANNDVTWSVGTSLRTLRQPGPYSTLPKGVFIPSNVVRSHDGNYPVCINDDPAIGSNGVIQRIPGKVVSTSSSTTCRFALDPVNGTPAVPWATSKFRWVVHGTSLVPN
jgi:hypothetical protein